MFQRSQCRSIIVDAESLPQLDALLDGDNGKLLLVVSDLEDPRCYRGRWPQHTFFGAGDLEAYAAWREPTLDGDAIAYLLFTSGSTGAPKGVWLRTGISLPSSTTLPFETYKTFCPYLVGDYETVSNELSLSSLV